MPKITFHAFAKSSDQEVRFSAGEYRNKMYFDLRIFVKDEEADEWFPTKKGITLPFDLVPELRKGLDRFNESLNSLKGGAEKP